MCIPNCVYIRIPLRGGILESKLMEGERLRRGAVIRDETFADEELGELWRIANKLESWSILFIRRIETYVFSLYFNSSFPNKLKQILIIISYP